jgi:hypothetical protein
VAAVVTAADNRWFHAMAVAALVGAALAFVWRWGAVGRRWWALAAVVSLIAGGAIYVLWVSTIAACTAKGADGRVVVIGTEFTQRGRQYHIDNPSDDNNAILEALADLGPEAAWTKESIERCRLRMLVTGTLWVPLFGGALLCATGLLGTSSTELLRTSRKKRVFISYSHGDAQIAGEVRDYLRQHGFEVILDADSMRAGGSISEFIANSVREADVVVSIVSIKSLVSAWVALETVTSFEREKGQQSKVFVPCTLTNEFLEPGFRLRCTAEIDARIREIESLLPRYAEEKLDSSDLDREKSRLYDLRNHLGKVLERLKESLCLELGEGKMVESLERLVEAIR